MVNGSEALRSISGSLILLSLVFAMISDID
jgi:hypothetical protein